MARIGTNKRPIIVKVTSEERAAEVVSICEANNWRFIIGFEEDEDVTDLHRALAAKERPTLKLQGSIPSKKKRRKR